PNQLPGSPTQLAPAAGAAAAAAPAAAAAKRSWLGPVAGIAAGLGIAALASHFGFGEALANMLTIALVVMAVALLVGFFLRKRAQGRASLAGAGAPVSALPSAAQQQGMFRSAEPVPPQGGSLIGSRLGGGLAPQGTASGSIPADFDAAGFARNAKSQFMALQAANDARDLDRLRDYLTPDMFELVRADLAADPTPQKTEVFGLEAQVLDVLEDADRYVVSVRFTGSVREQPAAVPEDLDEIWHLTKPRAGFGGWVIAGIQQKA
ncbi:MAG TPA: Tim44-like domain-containing protein, partial [Ramlibacter sp.]|nr:Tim44-like domain-containing protein [Ramlibacter sp.]